MEPLKNVAHMLEYIKRTHDNPAALNFHHEGKWITMSTRQMVDEVRWLAYGLKKLGMKEGDRVGILSHPCIHWSIAKFAIIMAGGVVVPTFANISDDNFVFEMEQTGVDIIFVGGEEQWLKHRLHRNLFKTTIALQGFGRDESAVGYDEALSLGKALEQEHPDWWGKWQETANGESLAFIIYTSGSTGVPKGVELTQYNLVGVIHCQNFGLGNPDDRYLSILPLAHIFGLCLNFIMIAWGVSIYYYNDIKNVGVICRELHPTLVVLVPRLLEKIYARMLANVQSAGGMKRMLGLWAFDLANDENDSLYKFLFHPIADMIVYQTLRAALGGNLRLIISGGAPLNPHLCHFFVDVGFPIYEGWGMTEACPVTVNTFGHRKIGSVGQPYGSNQVKVSAEGELLVKGPVVMKGYYRNSEANQKVFDEDGWLRTGDKGFIDEQGFVTIIGRIKELYKTSTGEYIAPIPIEQEIGKAPLIDMAMIVAEGRKYCSVLLYPNFEVVESLKSIHKMEKATDKEFLDSAFVKEEMHKLFENLNKHLNKWEQVRAYRFITDHPSIESGELTPSMKIRREVVMKKYAHLVEEMYS